MKSTCVLVLFLLHCLGDFCSCFMFSSGTLYNSTDDVVILDHSNFSTTILGSENAWVIEFYNSWCGHCVHFAPTWKLFGKSIKDWQHTVRVGVIDCAVDENIPICRDYEVMGYPSIRLFASRPSKGDVGTDMVTRTVEEMSHSIIDFLIKNQKANNGSKSWVNLQPYRGTIADVWKEVHPSIKQVVLIIEPPDSYVGKSSILDLGGYSSIAVRLKDFSSEEAKEYEAASHISLIFVKRDGKPEIVKKAATTREDLTDLIMKKLKLDKGMLPFKTVYDGLKSSSDVKKEDVEGAGDGRPEEINSDKLNYEDDLPDAAYRGAERKDQVYMVDIENAISYAMRHEVAQHKIISGEALKALQAFLDILVLYLPARPALHNFLSKLYEYTMRQNDSIKGEEYAAKLLAIQDSESVLPDHQHWIGCLGSDPRYRGYPCGLWTTFHVLTVNAVLQDGNNLSYNPRKVLQAIHGYVKYFFSCEYCSKHFQGMYKEDAETSVNVADDEILWLWRGHNKVNRRLSGDISEDPKHPKVQFPPSSSCSTCWDGNSLKEKEVLLYLKNIYSKGALSFQGTQTIMNSVKNRQSKVQEALQKHKAERLTVNKKRYGMNMDQEQPLRPLHTWGFNDTDISLCVFLYGISTVIIMSVYCLVVIRRKLRRKREAAALEKASQQIGRTGYFASNPLPS